jgi:D-tyrosyl-tRNA(Tyr) deacylase
MRAVVQRVSSAAVRVGDEVTGRIGTGYVVLLGVATGDTAEDGEWIAGRLVNLRLFDDVEGRMNLTLGDVSGGVLVVSQFTLLGSTKKGTRPSWHRAARPEEAVPLYEGFVARVAALTGRPVATGRFGAMMSVALENDGPVTLVLDSTLRE